MYIEQYGLYIKMCFNNEMNIEKNISSFDDIPSTIRIEDLVASTIYHNSKAIWSYNNKSIIMYDINQHSKSINCKILPGWQLRYLIKRTYNNMFSSRNIK